MQDALKALYEVVLRRKNEPSEGSYTRYLFEMGLDKILKKIGEECAETIIAAKNDNNEDTVLEICDLLYHLIIMMVHKGIALEEVAGELEKRSRKTGNLKNIKITDKNT